MRQEQSESTSLCLSHLMIFAICTAVSLSSAWSSPALANDALEEPIPSPPGRFFVVSDLNTKVFIPTAVAKELVQHSAKGLKVSGELLPFRAMDLSAKHGAWQEADLGASRIFVDENRNWFLELEGIRYQMLSSSPRSSRQSLALGLGVQNQEQMNSVSVGAMRVRESNLDATQGGLSSNVYYFRWVKWLK